MTPHGGDLDDFGSGDGAAFQALCKSCPAFAVEAAAVGLRTIRTHWGPINRQEAELRPEADQLFRQVQGIVDTAVVSTVPTTIPQTQSVLAEILKRLRELEKLMIGTAGSGPSTIPVTVPVPTMPVPTHPDDVARRHRAYRNGYRAARPGRRDVLDDRQSDRPNPDRRAAAADRAGRADHHPPRPDRRHVGAVYLGHHRARIGRGSATTKPPLSPIDKMLGGEALVGLKTPLAIAGYALMWILQTLGTMGTATGDKATTTGAILTALVTAFGALGVTAKFDRAFGALSKIAAILQKLPALLPPPVPPGAAVN